MENTNRPIPDVPEEIEADAPQAAAPDAAEQPAAPLKGWDSVLYGLPDGDTPRRPDSGSLPPVYGSGLGYRWQGFLIYFFMWVYGVIVALNGIPFLNSETRTTSLDSLDPRYLPYWDPTITGFGVTLIIMGVAIIVTRFLLARHLRCALPVFFTVSLLDFILPLLMPLAVHLAMYPFSRLMPVQTLYASILSSEMRDEYLIPTIVRAVLLVFHIFYYRRRRVDFRNRIFSRKAPQ